MDAPLIIAPTGLNGMLDPDGDVALARAAASINIPFTLSTFSTTRLEDVAARAGGRLWMQLYVMRERSSARELVRRAAAAGYEALVFTCDANVFGSREWDRRNYRAPGRPTLATLTDILRHPRWLAAMARSGGLPRLRNLESFLPRAVDFRPGRQHGHTAADGRQHQLGRSGVDARGVAGESSWSRAS